MKMMSYITNKKAISSNYIQRNKSFCRFIFTYSKKSNKENLSWKKNCDADVVFFPSKCLSVSEKITVVRDRVLNEIGSSDTWNQLK